MSELSDLSQTDASNVDQAKLGQPEGMARSSVNNRGRELEGAVRRWYENPEWTQLLTEQAGPTYVISTISDVAIRVVGTPPTDATGRFPIGARLRISVSGASAVEGHVSARSYAAPNNDVTIDFPPIGSSSTEFGQAGMGTAANPSNFLILGFGPTERVEPGSVRMVDAGTHDAIVDDGVGNLLFEGANVGTIDYATSACIVNGLAVAFDSDVVVTFARTSTVPAGANRVEHYFARGLRDAAFRETGLGAGQVPTSDQLGAAAFREPGTGGELDADTVDGRHADDLVDAAAELRNPLVNSAFWWSARGFRFDATSAFGADDGAMTADQWRLLCEANDDFIVSIDPANAVIGGAGVPSGELRLDVSVTNPAPPNSRKGGFLQILEASQCVALRGRTVTFSIYAKKTGLIGPIRMSVLQWGGGIDAPTTDPVNVWGAAGVNPTLVANWTYATGAPVAQTVTGALTRFSVTATLNGTFNNLAVFLWVDDNDMNAGDRLSLYAAQLELGDRATPWRGLSIGEEAIRCARYVRSTFPPGINPAQNVGATSGNLRAQNVLSLAWPVKMQRAPTVTTFNPVAANANWQSGNVPAVVPSEVGIAITNGGANDSIHFVADAGF